MTRTFGKLEITAITGVSFCDAINALPVIAVIGRGVAFRQLLPAPDQGDVRVDRVVPVGFADIGI